MKRLFSVVTITLAVVGLASAQQWGNNRGLSQPITVSGTLELQNGTIAVVTEDAAYYVPALERYIGFIDGLKSGAQVQLEGYIVGNGTYVQPGNVTIDGKRYDFTVNTPRGTPYGGYGHRNNNRRRDAGYGRCCWG